MARTQTIVRTLVHGSTSPGYTVETSGSSQVSIESAIADAVYNVPFARSFNYADILSLWIHATANMTLSTNGTDEVWTISDTPTVSGGTFTITYAAQTTAAIDWDATAAEVQTALEAISTIGVGDVIVTGGPLPGTDLVITAAGALAGQNLTAPTLNTGSLTGGGNFSLATTTGGAAVSQTISLIANQPLEWVLSDGYFANPFTANVTRILVTNASGGAGTFTLDVLLA